MFLKYSCPLLTVLGLVGLYSLGAVLGRPEVAIASLGQRSNFAYVKLAGTVCDVPRFYLSPGSADPTAGSLEFCLDDGTGRTRIKTFEDATRRIVNEGKVPALGDRGSVIGNFQMRSYRHSVVVGAPEELTFSRPEPSRKVRSDEVAWAAQTDFAELERVTVTGYVSFVKTRDDSAYEAGFSLSGGKRTDANGKRRYLSIVFSWSQLEQWGAVAAGQNEWAAAPPKGSLVEVTGVLSYEGFGKWAGWKLHPAEVGDIRVLKGPDEKRWKEGPRAGRPARRMPAPAGREGQP
jgi:hypothetical protein